MENHDTNERLDRLEKLVTSKNRRGSQLCWIKWNDNSKYGYEIQNAKEDVIWLFHEIRRLNDENRELKEFVEHFREEVSKEIKSR